MELDAELLTARGQAVAFVRTHAGEKGDAVAETCRRRGRIRRGAADPPLRIAFELIARRVSDRDQVEHHTLNSTCNTSPSFTG